MTKSKDEFTFTLSKAVTFHSGPTQAETFVLVLKAPSNKNRKESARLKQGFFRAIKEMQDAMKDKVIATTIDTGVEVTADDMGGAEVMSLIMMSGVDLGAFQEDFRLLLLNDTCFVDGTVKLTNHIYDALSDDDTERLMGEYMTNFLLASHLTKMMAK